MSLPVRAVPLVEYDGYGREERFGALRGAPKVIAPNEHAYVRLRLAMVVEPEAGSHRDQSLLADGFLLSSEPS